MHPIDTFGRPAAALLTAAAGVQLAWARHRVGLAARRVAAARGVWLAAVWADVEAR